MVVKTGLPGTIVTYVRCMRYSLMSLQYIVLGMCFMGDNGKSVDVYAPLNNFISRRSRSMLQTRSEGGDITVVVHLSLAIITMVRFRLREVA